MLHTAAIFCARCPRNRNGLVYSTKEFLNSLIRRTDAMHRRNALTQRINAVGGGIGRRG